jgi:thiol-disulfide isomerase/thioredoxin
VVPSIGEGYNMTQLLLRVGLLILVSLLLYLFTRFGRLFVEKQRKRALAAPAIDGMAVIKGEDVGLHFVRILAFSSADCKQCHQLQTPALQRVEQIHGEKVNVVEVDAVHSPELVQRYHVLTIPTTVVLDASGQAQAVNYGFANTQRLLNQVDLVLAKGSQTATS